MSANAGHRPMPSSTRLEPYISASARPSKGAARIVSSGCASITVTGRPAWSRVNASSRPVWPPPTIRMGAGGLAVDPPCARDAGGRGKSPDQERWLGRAERCSREDLSFSSARCSIWRTRSLLMPSLWPSSSSVRASSRRRRSLMIVCSRAQLVERLGEPEGAGAAVARQGHTFLGRRPLVRQKILPLVLAVGADRRVQRLVGAGQADLHRLDVGEIDGQLLRDQRAAAIVERAAAVLDLGAQPAQIEEQRLLRRRGAGAHHRPVAQDVILHRRANPRGGVGREAHLALGLEACRRLHQADRALLHQIAHRQAVVAKPGRGADHQAHVGQHQLVQRCLVARPPPAPRQVLLALPRQQRRAHRPADELAVRLLGGHVHKSHVPALSARPTADRRLTRGGWLIDNQKIEPKVPVGRSGTRKLRIV